MLKFFGSIWNVITVVRNGLANFIFILLVVIILIALLTPGEEPLPDKAPLFVAPSGVLVDQLTYQPSLFDLLEDEPQQHETLVRDVVESIAHAKNDDRITALILNLNRLQRGSFAKLEEIGQAIERFKESGKPVLAFADSFGQGQYYLASHADTIYLNPLGNLSLPGFGIYGSYFKEATDKLSLKFHLFKVGDFKDAAEPFVRNDMSEASREHNSQWVFELWRRYTSKVETLRELPAGALESFITTLPDTLAQSEFGLAQVAKDAGLVDKLITRVELNQELIERFGKDKNSDFFQAIDYRRYHNKVAGKAYPNKENIGLIIASGTIIDGSAPEGQIGGDSLSALIRQARKDESLKALILRVDSGGGSAFASEVVRNQLLQARQEGLPVYVSMGSVAASGGYWISTAADEIWAQPSTITGSIGVWGLVPNVTESFKRLGIHNDGFGTTPLSDIYQIDRPLSPMAQKVFQSGVDNIYREFITLVADARNKLPEDIHEIAQGRVWTGAKAQEFGLIDQLGTLSDLIDNIRANMQKDDLSVKLIQAPLSPSEQFLRTLLESTQILGEQVRNAVIDEEVVRYVEELPPYQILKSFNSQGAKIYAQCLACISP